jgi:enoyl-CoA hydratase/carnithine racemase
MPEVAQEVEVSRTGAVLHIRLNRADRRNALTWPMYSAMSDAIADGEADGGIRTILFSGSGEAFCAGNDLNAFMADPPSGTDGPVFRFLRTISAAKKVLIAAVHGACVGIGATMLLHCDFVVASRDARLSFPFMNLGLIPEAASTLLLPRAIGHLRAAELLLFGKAIDAETAMQWGLVNRVVDPEALTAAADELTSLIGSLPPGAVQLAKGLMKDDRTGISARIEQEAGIFVDRLASPEFREAGTAFLERRPADFSRFR